MIFLILRMLSSWEENKLSIALEGHLNLKKLVTSMQQDILLENEAWSKALLDKKVPVISIASPIFDKVISNAQEAKARDSYLIGIAPESMGLKYLII